MPTCKLSSAIQGKKYFIYHPLVKNIPYLIYIYKKTVSIYTLPKKYDKNIAPYPFESNATKNKSAWAYTKFIKEYKYKKVFIGSSKGKSNISHHYKTKNNGILLELSKKDYVFIGEIGIIEFQLDDKILKLLTPLGYPVIYGEKHIYHLYKKNTIKIINRKDLPKKMTNSEIEDTFYNPIAHEYISVKRI
jgi:hypothetical protein